MNVANSLAAWHEMVRTGDMTNLPSLIHPDAVFRSPVAHTPYHSAQAMAVVLSNVSQVFQDFAYHRQFVRRKSTPCHLVELASDGVLDAVGEG